MSQPLTIDTDLMNRVTRIVKGVIETVVMPSFRALRPEDIHHKDTPGDPEDVVTVVDRETERRLVELLSGVVQGATFVGEEAVSEDPHILSALSGSAPAWLIDPIDGTKNFAKGDPRFGVMLALVEQGVTRASWMGVPAAGTGAFVVAALHGEGTYINDIRSVPPIHSNPPRGTVHTRMAPPEIAGVVIDRLRGRYVPIESTGSAATEYSGIILGEKDFVIYYRLLPWDHAPGALAITEAGGAAIHLSGEPYSPLSPNQITIFAASRALAETVREWITGASAAQP